MCTHIPSAMLPSPPSKFPPHNGNSQPTYLPQPKKISPNLTHEKRIRSAHCFVDSSHSSGKYVQSSRFWSCATLIINHCSSQNEGNPIASIAAAQVVKKLKNGTHECNLHELDGDCRGPIHENLRKWRTHECDSRHPIAPIGTHEEEGSDGRGLGGKAGLGDRRGAKLVVRWIAEKSEELGE